MWTVEAVREVTDVGGFGLSSDITNIEKEINIQSPRYSIHREQLSVFPFAMTFEDFVCGFTTDSSEYFSVDPTEGRMGRQGEAAQVFDVTFNSQGFTGEFKATLCIVFPDDKPF